MIYGGQASDPIGPDESAIPPRGSITLQAAALRVISGGQVPDRIGPDEQFPHAVVLLFKQPLYECGCQASGHIGPDESAIPRRGVFTFQATALRAKLCRLINSLRPVALCTNQCCECPTCDHHLQLE